MKVCNKTALVTGGASGIGLAYTKELLQNGIKSVAIIDLPTSKGEDIVAELEKEFGKGSTVFFACDVRNADQFEATVEKVIDTFKGLDIFVNNAGLFNEKDWEHMIDINLTAVVRGTYLALKFMGKNNGGMGGTVMNISSLAGIQVIKLFPTYSSTKQAVINYSRAMSEYYDRTGVRILVICPGFTLTSFIRTDGSGDLELATFDEKRDFALTIIIQPVEFVANCMVDILKSGKNGTVWAIENSQPPYVLEFPPCHGVKRSDA